LVADGGFDALTHALEAYTATGAGVISNALAKEAFRLVLEQLRPSFEGDLTARALVHQGASMAGLAFTQAGLGLCHGMSHALGGLLHLPHGRLNAILLPAVMDCNAPGCGKAYAALARCVGLEGRAETVGVRNLRNTLTRLRKDLGLPGTLAEAGIPPKDLYPHRQALVEAVLADPCCQTNPVPVTADMVGQVLKAVMGHE
jgi:alcohol dehydrogenase class IV